ncbi:response regulator transcription factor [Evansella sp. AB-rgal1]|uniref:response regulator transcription factor n=1 Tax=Evansella sp. AB-rgal1 TaxID=3242696 RepID=UPI00359D35E6
MRGQVIVIVEDEVAIAKMVKTVLRKEGFSEIYIAETASQALALVEKQRVDFILLDVMLPDRSGFDICPELRKLSNAYIIFLTAKVSDFDKLTGFAIGADDYITKPFNPLEIVARIKAKIRRDGAVTTKEEQSTRNLVYSCDRFAINEQGGELLIDGVVTPCPAQVFHLLLYFCKHPNQVFSKTQLLEAVWGMDSYVDDNTVMVHIRRIRERIEIDPSDPKYLLTVRGLGYKLIKESNT